MSTPLIPTVVQEQEFWFGDGSDGDVVIDGLVTLTRDMYYNSLVINLGCVLNTYTYRVFVKNQLALLGGTIECTTETGNTTVGNLWMMEGNPSGQTSGGTITGYGGSGTVGTSGYPVDSVSTVGTQIKYLAASPFWNYTMMPLLSVYGGSAGGSANSGSSIISGCGGGCVLVYARLIVATAQSFIQANGGAPTNADFNSGAGAGGGGVVTIVTATPRDTLTNVTIRAVTGDLKNANGRVYYFQL